MKPDEVLEVSLKLPFAPGAEANKDKSKEGNTQPGKQSQGTGGALLNKQRPGLGGLGTLLPRPRFTSPAAPLLAPQNPGLDGQSGSNANDGGHFVLRCGNLLMSAEVQLQSPCPACMQYTGWPGYLLPTDNTALFIALWGRILHRNSGKDLFFVHCKTWTNSKGRDYGTGCMHRWGPAHLYQSEAEDSGIFVVVHR